MGTSASAPLWGSLPPLLGSLSGDDDGGEDEDVDGSSQGVHSSSAPVPVEEALFDLLASALHPDNAPFVVLLEGDGPARASGRGRKRKAGQALGGGAAMVVDVDGEGDEVGDGADDGEETTAQFFVKELRRG